MPKGKHTALRITLTPEDRATLETWQRAQVQPSGRVRRGRILLLLAEGMPITRVAATVGISRRFVYKWVARFRAQGVAGLVDLPKGKRPRSGEDEA